MAKAAAGKTITPLFSAAEIAARVDALAGDIAATSPRDLVIVAILKGSFIFAADLIRALYRTDGGVAPAGFPGEQTKSSCVRAPTSSGTLSHAGAKLRAASLAT